MAEFVNCVRILEKMFNDFNLSYDLFVECVHCLKEYVKRNELKTDIVVCATIFYYFLKTRGYKITLKQIQEYCGVSHAIIKRYKYDVLRYVLPKSEP